MWWCRQRTLAGQSPWERSLVGTLGSSPAWVCGEGWTSHKVCQGWKPLWSDHPGTRPPQHHGSPILSTSSIFSNLIETKTRPLSPNANQVVAWAVTWLTQQAWVLKPWTFQRNHWSLTSFWVNLWALGISCLVRVSLYTRDLGPSISCMLQRDLWQTPVFVCTPGVLGHTVSFWPLGGWRLSS